MRAALRGMKLRLSYATLSTPLRPHAPAELMAVRSSARSDLTTVDAYVWSAASILQRGLADRHAGQLR